MILKGRCAPACSTFQKNLSSIPCSKCKFPKNLTYVPYGFISSLSLLSIELAISILIEQFRNYKVTAADIAIAIQIKGNVGDLRSATRFLQLGVGLHGLTVGKIVAFPLFGHVNLAAVLEDVGAIVAKSHLDVGVETELVNARWLMHKPIEGGLFRRGCLSERSRVGRYSLFSHYFLNYNLNIS